eukprot:TRINITY_DN16115_c0_g1_i1.p1 TRINITY_DN16115_c0_g1~~TRINITY_DN16115_c0_g1_i1.p1  ORF type:complete len:197 (+),score=33.07 TRINITY_DN16115_c0_g1_i1:30-593(+)
MSEAGKGNGNLKIVVLGSGAVGKSAITMRYVKNDFSEFYNPTVEDSYFKQVTIQDTTVTLEILDTAGTDQFKLMREIYLQNSEGFIVVYSIASRTSFNEVNDVLESIKRVKGEGQPVILVGNKCDLPNKEVGTDAGQAKATEHGAMFIEVSAKENIGIDKLFKTLVESVLAKRGSGKTSSGCACVVC